MDRHSCSVVITFIWPTNGTRRHYATLPGSTETIVCVHRPVHSKITLTYLLTYFRAQTIFHTRRGKIVWSTAYSIFVPCSLKIGDTTSSKMYYVTSHKAWNYERALKRRLVVGIIPLGPSERQETKIHKTWSLCQPQIALASFQAQKHTPPVHRSPGILHWSFSGSTRLSLLHSASTA